MSCFGLDMNGKTLKKLAIVFVALILVGYGLSAMTPLSIVTPGWEIYNSIGGIKSGTSVLTQSWQFTSPNDIGNSYWKVDVDSPNYGVPTVMVTSTDISHVDFTGQVTPSNSPAQTRTVTIDNHTYVLDYHIYMFDVTIRSVADRVTVATTWDGVPKWEHETSWSQQSTAYANDNPARVGSMFTGGTFVKFVINPWTGVPTVDVPEDYRINDAWAGVMNSYVANLQVGGVINQYNEDYSFSAEAPALEQAALNIGAQVNMYEDLGGFSTQAPTTNWDTQVTPDVRIPSTVVLYLPVQLQSGAYLSKRVFDVMSLSPVDVYVQYTVRVDVLQTHDFVLETAYNPPTAAPPVDWIGYVQTWYEGLLDGLSDPMGQLWVFFILIVIVMILVTVLNPGLWVNMTHLMRGRRGGGD